MALKPFRLPVAIVTADPSRDREEIRDGQGRIVSPAERGSKLVNAGETVMLEPAEAEWFYKRHGTIEAFDARQAKIEAGKQAFRDQCEMDNLSQTRKTNVRP